MGSITESNKRIAKNTIFLYSRMLLTMFVGLYTSRVVLQTLGLENFGIYNIVGGVVVLFTFINNAMASATQRHLSYELGKKDGNISEIYSACLNIHIGIAFIILVLSETIGLWFINTQMNFPSNKMDIVNIVYQFTILNCLTLILRVPNNALIIAHEKMSFYAYIGIIESISKLAIVYFLLLTNNNRLIFYAILLFIVSLIVNICFKVYCKKSFQDTNYLHINDRKRYKGLISFSGWAMFGSIANVGLQQGINVIINIFYGVGLNAAVGIANQVNGQIMTLVAGFQQALNPQLTKSEAEGDRSRQFTLICTSSKYSYYIMFFVAFPLLLNLEYILTLWLGKYPPHTESICTAIIIGALIECFSGPLWVTIFATGKIKSYQITISILLLINIPISYVGGKYGMTPESMFYIRDIIYIFALILRIIYLRNLIGFNILHFIKKTILPSLFCSTILFIVVIPTISIIKANSFFEFCYTTIILLIIEFIIFFTIGLNNEEKKYIHSIIKSKLKK